MKLSHEINYFSKYPADKFDIEYDFTNDLPDSDTLSTCTATIFNSSGTDKTASMISDTDVVTPDCTFTIDAGYSGETYSIKLVGVTLGAKKFTQYIKCEVFGTLTINSKLGDDTANSYVTLKEANDYVRNKYGHDSKWDTLSTEGKKRLLVEAADMLNKFNYIDDKYYSSQSLIFPLNNHSVITGNCATPITSNSFKHTNLKSDTYGKYPTDYWKYGTIHITSGTPVHDIRSINNSNVTTGSITVDSAFSDTLTTNTGFVAFEPLFDDIKDAQTEQALFLIENTGVDTLQTYKSLGAEEVQIGDVRVRFGDSTSQKMTIAPSVRKMISRWLRRKVKVARR